MIYRQSISRKAAVACSREKVCACSAYPWLHRVGFGRCEIIALSCDECDGRGFVFSDCAALYGECAACGGTGVQR